MSEKYREIGKRKRERRREGREYVCVRNREVEKQKEREIEK